MDKVGIETGPLFNVDQTRDHAQNVLDEAYSAVTNNFPKGTRSKAQKKALKKFNEAYQLMSKRAGEVFTA